MAVRIAPCSKPRFNLITSRGLLFFMPVVREKLCDVYLYSEDVVG
jgi:hypothetical protein